MVTYDGPARDEQAMGGELLPIERHVATERFGKQALRTAHDISVSLAEGGADEPVVLRRNGPHRSISGLEALLDEALADDGARTDDEVRADDEARTTEQEVP
jgi:hypothetical protein